MKKFLILIFFTACFYVSARAQQFTVMGSVVDEYGRVLQGVTVKSNKTSATATSGPDGAFEVTSLPGDVLQFSYPNYKTNITTVPDSSTIIIAKLTPTAFITPPKTDVLYESRDNQKILGSVASVYTDQLTSLRPQHYMRML